MSFVKEEDIAGIVVRYLEQQGWDVYQEVSPRHGGGRADIVALRGPLVRVVEVKTSFTAALVEQAWNWIWWAHYVHVAVPSHKVTRHVPGRAVLRRFCRDNGIGIFDVREQGWREIKIGVRELEPARIMRTAKADMFRDTIRPEHKYYGKAGNADNRYWTPWRDTCERWRRYIEKNPGCSLKELVEKVGHHYSSDSSAKSNMARYLRDGIVKGVVVRRGKGNRFALFPKCSGPEETRRGRRPGRENGGG